MPSQRDIAPHDVIDHRPAQTPVRQQGDRFTCVGFAVSAAHEWVAADATVRSPEDVIWAAHQAGSPAVREDTSVEFALIGLSAHEHATETAWPYGMPPWPADRPAAATAAINRRALPPWRRLPSTSASSVTAELAAGIAVVLTVRVVVAAWQAMDGVVDAEAGRKSPGLHAVLAVGALADGTGNTQQIVIKNSWGPAWGDAGFGSLSSRYLDSYGVVAHAMEQ